MIWDAITPIMTSLLYVPAHQSLTTDVLFNCFDVARACFTIYIVHTANAGNIDVTNRRVRDCYVHIISISQIPRWIRQISHNAPFCNRNVHIYVKMVHCGIWGGALWGLCNRFIYPDHFVSATVCWYLQHEPLINTPFRLYLQVSQTRVIYSTGNLGKYSSLSV